MFSPRQRLKEVIATIASASFIYQKHLRKWISSQRQTLCRRQSLISIAILYIRRLSVFFLSLYLTFILTGLFINICTVKTPFTGNGHHHEMKAKAPEFRAGYIGELCESPSPATEKRIYFVETSGEKCLRPRQACAIESAARTNPDMKIQIYMSTSPPPGTPEQDGGYGLNRQCKSMDVLSKFPNVQIIREDLTRHLFNTPLESLLHSGKFEKSKFSYQHLSDAVRIALLYKSGGIYLDLDVVVLRSLGCLRNTAGMVLMFHNKIGIENGVLIFDKGHELLAHYMRLMEKEYDPTGRESIGPTGFLKAADEFCGIGICEACEFGKLFICRDNFNLTVLYSHAFYPVPFLERTRFFEPNFHLKELDNLQTSYIVHVYGSGHGAQVVPSSLYGFLAQRFCPSIYGASLTKSGKSKF